MAYNFKYTLSVEEYADYVSFTGWEAPWQRKYRIRYLLNIGFSVIIMMVAGIIIMDKISPTRKNHNYTLVIILLIIFFIIAMWAIAYQAPYSMKAKARKFLARDENSRILDENELYITNENIIYNSTGSKSAVKWDSITKYAETNTYFFLYLNEASAYLIPKRLFSSQNEIDEFDKFLTEKIPISSSFRSLGI